MTELHRVFFDGNDGSEQYGYLLWFDLSKRDLAAIGDSLKVGLRVVIYSPDELEYEAILEHDEEGNWIGRPIKGTMRYIGKAAEWATKNAK